MTNIIFFVIAVCLTLGFPLQAKAYLKINEVYSRPTTDQQEWVELYLPHTDPGINVSGWSLWDTESSPSLLFTFEEGAFLSSGSYFVPSTNNKLNNAGDTLVIKDANSNFIDVFSYTGGESEKSWSLMANGSIQQTSPTKGSANLESVTPTPTLTPTISPTLIPTPTPTTNPQLHPQLTSLMACPKVGSEWVEIKNPHEVAISLENYEIWDAKNRFHRFTNSNILNPNEILKIETSFSILNNSGDTLAIYSPNNELVESFNYEDCDSLIPWSKNDDGVWVLGLTDSSNNQNDLVLKNTAIATNEFAGKILGKNITKTSAKSSYKPFKPSNLPDLKLATTPPAWDFSENVVFFESPLTIWGGLSVIIGGLLIGGSNLWNFYVEKQTAQLKKFP